MENQKDHFLLLHGDHPTLPAGEVRAILEAEDLPHRIKGTLPQILRGSLDEACILAISKRAYMTRLCAEELFFVEDDPTEILRAVNEALPLPWGEREGSFSVSLHRVQRSALDIDLKSLRRGIAETVRAKTGAEIDVGRPGTRFLGLFSRGYFLFGHLLSEISPKRLADRRPSSRPFFHPTALQPKLAGCMVNLSRASPGELLLDPFCGSASILLEAGLLGCRTMGSDIQPLMVKGSRTNLIHYGVELFHLVRADARRLPLTRVDAVATDPPYGRSAKTTGVPLRALLGDFFHSVAEVLRRGGYLCLASPAEIGLVDLGEGAGLKAVESYIIPVHGSLTRELAVFKRV
ncbi:MAG: hypothetical protein ACETVR_04200 [Candidatus Bathyarchaeia archaeon]